MDYLPTPEHLSWNRVKDPLDEQALLEDEQQYQEDLQELMGWDCKDAEEDHDEEEVEDDQEHFDAQDNEEFNDDEHSAHYAEPPS